MRIVSCLQNGTRGFQKLEVNGCELPRSVFHFKPSIQSEHCITINEFGLSVAILAQAILAQVRNTVLKSEIPFVYRAWGRV